MLSAVSLFRRSIDDARGLSGLYDYLTTTITTPLSFDDLLRSQIVYSVSAFDKLMHDVIRLGMVAYFTGTRLATPKFKAELISIEFHGELLSATFPPREYLFEREIVRKLSIQTFQDPIKIADGLSYIWSEPNKWDKIGLKMGDDARQIKERLKLIVTQRNAIVHESDINPLSGVKNLISRAVVNESTDFLELCGCTIVELIK